MAKINLHNVEELVKLFRSPDGKKRLDEFANINLKAEDVAEALGVSRQTFRAAFKIIYSGYSGWRDYVATYLGMERYEASKARDGIREMAEIRERKERYEPSESGYVGPGKGLIIIRRKTRRSHH